MAHDAPHFLGMLIVMLAAAKWLGRLAQRVGQPAVLGELLAGVLVGKSALGLVDPSHDAIHLFAELGVIILLFTIGLETELRKLLAVGTASSAVAVAGVVLPFVLGYATCRLSGLGELVAVVTGASLTATSVGITARVLSEMGALQSAEGQVVLGAAVLDDILGLIILGVVGGLARGEGISLGRVGGTTAMAFGFLAATLLIGKPLLSWVMPRLGRLRSPQSPTILALLLALALAWLADRAGSAMIIGAFAAGLLLADLPRSHEIEHGITALGHFFVPLFFVSVGAAVDVTLLNPLDLANQRLLLISGLLTAGGVAGKYLAGFTPFWFRGNKRLIGIAMIPRGEVGLIFAQMGLSSGTLDPAMFAAVTLVVMVTTFLAPPLLRFMAPRTLSAGVSRPSEGIDELVNEG
jgi:Kef-type K+ transport system membrane component KefB